MVRITTLGRAPVNEPKSDTLKLTKRSTGINKSSSVWIQVGLRQVKGQREIEAGGVG